VENLDVGVGLGYLWFHDDDSDPATTGNGTGDLALGGRYRFFASEKQGIEAAWITGVSTPTGSRSDEHEWGCSQE
jgi:hypothetical protein